MEQKPKNEAEVMEPDATASETAEAEQAAEDGQTPGETLEAALAAARAEAEEYKNRWHRAVADFENMRRRAQKDKDEALQFGNQKLIVSLLPVLDNLERALASAEGSSLKEGVELVARQFRDTLAKQGVQPIEAMGQPFDPNLHEAVMQEDGGDYSEPTVVMELQKGYKLNDRVIRPSMVRVARP